MALVVSMVVGSRFVVGGSGDRAEFWVCCDGWNVLLLVCQFHLLHPLVVAILTNGLHKNELKLLFSN